jgi:glycosyltransferase involved in cell wall biosynthesis
MRVLVLTPYPHGTTAGPRSSFELWERVLLDAGISLDYEVFETDHLHEIIYAPDRTADKALEMARAYSRFVPNVLRRVSRYDAVLVNREATLIGPAILERWVARLGKPLIYQLDDPLYIPYRSPSNGWLSYLKCFGKVATLCRLSRVVIANSPSHVAFARRHNANVWEIPSVVDADVYTGWKQRATKNGRVCIGWSGSPSTVGNLQVIRAPLRQLSTRGDVDVLLIGAQDFGLPDVQHTGLRWRAATEVDDLRRLDVGLLPVPQTPWTPHKFYLKLVQYMALGIAPVATPLGSNRVVVEHGVTGFLAGDDPAWRESVTRLVEDRDLREDIGQRAADVARERFTLQANAETIVAAFRSAWNGR